LGLTEAEIAYDDLVDPYGIEFWPEFKGRDGCRTPMVWQAHVRNGGFSAADRTWLPVPAQHLAYAVDQQDNLANSTLSYYRSVLRFRKEHPELIKGDIELVGDTPESVLAFTRSHETGALFCAFNMSTEPAVFELPAGLAPADVGAPGSDAQIEGNRLSFGPFGSYIGRIK